MSQKVRVRFAPSPTGPLHIGGLRTALFNYLFAKKNGGDFLLRIEDTDQNRFVPGAENYIIEALNWCGIPYDEGVGKGGAHAPYRQSERKEIYQKYVQELLDNGHAYYAFDTQESLDNQRKIAEEKGEVFIYNWQNRLELDNSLSLSEEALKERLHKGEEFVIRFKIPQEILTMNDLIRGEVVVDTKTLDDKVLYKSDGMPTYHLANIVDDHLMEISHVIRGEEWLPSMPLHLLLYRAFGWQAPKFAHLPLILKPVGNGKLSKRDGDKMGFPVFPLLWTDVETGTISRGYREDGYLPEALLNFLALLGWNPGGDQEIYSKEELIQLFDLERVHKAGARFDIEKVKWFNHQYLQKKDTSSLVVEFQKILHQKEIEISAEKSEKIIDLVKERATFLSDFWDLTAFFFIAPKSYDEKNLDKYMKTETPEIISDICHILEEKFVFSAEELEQILKAYLSEKKIPLGQVMPLIRLALVGEMKGPNVFEIMVLLGKEETLSRLKKIVKKGN